MAVLQCEICGGKLIGKPGGIFECDSCGMEYSTEWAKEKIQEIKGTVKVEGTVEVTGKVQVEGGSVTVEGTATKTSLLKRAKMCCAEGEWGKAKELLEQVLNVDPECSEAYLYRYMVRNTFRFPKEIESLYFDKDPDIKKASRFANGETKALITQLKAASLQYQEKVFEKLGCQRGIAQKVEHHFCCGYNFLVGLKSDGTIVTTGKDSDQYIIDKSANRNIKSIVCKCCYAIGLCFDGSVVAWGDNDDGCCDVKGWHNIVKVACGDHHVVGLCADGKVVSAGNIDCGRCDVAGWQDVIDIACGFEHSVGVRSDGTVVSTGSNEYGQRNVDDWEGISSVCSGIYHTVGLRLDGTVTATGSNENGQCNISKWKDILSVDCGWFHTVGLRLDGSVVATGNNEDGRCEVSSWENIVAIACGDEHTVGLQSDGTVVAVGRNEEGQCDVANWKNIIAIACSGSHTMGLRANGTVIATGTEQENVQDWKLFNSVQTLDEEVEMGKAADANRIALQKVEEQQRFIQQKVLDECVIAAQKAEEDHKRICRAELMRERIDLEKEQCSLKGLFSGRRRKEIESRLVQIEQELKEL